MDPESNWSAATFVRMMSTSFKPFMNLPVISSTVDFLYEFMLFFFLPIGVVITVAIFAAWVVSCLYKYLFSRYATPEELYEEAMLLLKKDTTKDRRKALSNLRLVIQLRRDFMNAYIVLATELFYGELQIESEEYRERGGALLRRKKSTSLSTPNLLLEECQKVIHRGLSFDPSNKTLLKLKTELKLVECYGLRSNHVQMLSIGSFGWR